MQLSLTDEQQAIVDALHDFARNEVRPAARECEAEGAPIERVAKGLFEMGVASPLPAEFGGQGTFDAVTSVLISEEIAWGDPGVAFGVLQSGLAATIVDSIGTDQQRSELLPKLADGGAFASAERDAGADITNLETTAVGGITGLKYAVTAVDSPVHLVVASGEHPTVWVLTDKGFTATPEDKLGLRGARTFKVRYDSAGATLLGTKEQDPSTTLLVLLRAKLLNASIALGLGRAALEYATDYAQERTAFGRPIGAFQAISFKIADRAMDLESARLLVWEAAAAIDKGDADAERLTFAACGHAVAAGLACADDGVQILGGHGYMRDHPEEMWYRDALTLATFDSPSLVGDLHLAQTFKGGAR